MAGSVLWPKPSTTDCLHPQDRAPGSGSPLALRQGSCNFSQTLAHCASTSQQNVPKLKGCATAAATSAAQKWQFHTLRQSVRATVVYTEAHSLSELYTTLKTKAGNGRAALSVLPLGNWLRHAPSVTAHGNHLPQGCQWPKLTWGHHQQGTMGRPEAARHCLPSAAQTQPGAAQRAKAHPHCSGPQTQKCFTSQANSYCVFLM